MYITVDTIITAASLLGAGKRSLRCGTERNKKNLRASDHPLVMPTQ